MHKDWVIRISAFSLGALLAIGAHGQTTERIVIDGSTGGMPLAAALAKAFQERNPGVTIEIGKNAWGQVYSRSIILLIWPNSAFERDAPKAARPSI